MKAVETLKDIQHLIENSDDQIIEQIQAYIDHQLLILDDEQIEYVEQKRA